MSETNGGAPPTEPTAPAAPEKPAPPPAPTDAQTLALFQHLEAPLKHVIGTMVRGVMTGTPGVPPHLVLNAISWMTGHIVASSINADIATLVAVRRGFRECFEDGIKKTKMVQPPMQMPGQGGGSMMRHVPGAGRG